MYTPDNSLNDLLGDELFARNHDYSFSDELIDMIPMEMRTEPLSLLADTLTLPRGVPYPSQTAVNVANMLHELCDRDRYEFVKLWAEETPEDYFPHTDGSRDGVGLLLFKQSFRAGSPVALVVPGGAYVEVAVSEEGMGTANTLEKAGYAVAVMNYRIAPAHYPAPQEDLALAIKYLRANAGKTGVNADDLLVIGYSAGGHLAASEALLHEETEETLMKELAKEFPALHESYRGISARPDKVCLAYPVISFVEEVHETSVLSLSGGDGTLLDKLSVELHVDRSYPKTFVWACDDDKSVPPSNAKRMAEALNRAGADVLYRTYPTGGHGIATGEGTSAAGWVDEMVKYMK